MQKCIQFSRYNIKFMLAPQKIRIFRLSSFQIGWDYWNETFGSFIAAHTVRTVRGGVQ